MSFFSEGMRAKGGEWRTAGATDPWTGDEEEADERGRGNIGGLSPTCSCVLQIYTVNYTIECITNNP